MKRPIKVLIIIWAILIFCFYYYNFVRAFWDDKKVEIMTLIESVRSIGINK